VSSDSIEMARAALSEAFPEVGVPFEPYGSRVVVQMRRLSTKTRGGIVVVEDTRETAKWNNQIGKVVALGPLSFCHRDTGKPWAEGNWCKVGDYVRVPRWDGDRIEVPIKDEDPVVLVLFQDYQLLGRVKGDPLEQRVYVL